MEQWHTCKEEAKDAILLFRLGDFYEAFFEDAEKIAEDLGVALTKRQGTPMAGVPYHAAESYIEKLVRKGRVVAIAEQLENPKDVKGIVKRGITRIVSPATLLSDSYLHDKTSTAFVCLYCYDKKIAYAKLDVSTGELEVAEFEEKKAVLDELYKVQPKELLLTSSTESMLDDVLRECALTFSFRKIVKEDWSFDHSLALDFLQRHFSVLTLDGFGVRGLDAAQVACGTLLSVVQDELRVFIGNVIQITPLQRDSFVGIDRATERNLELVEPLSTSSGETLFTHLDKTKTAMGGRLLKQWILRPLLSVKDITERQDCIEALSSLYELEDTLTPIRDLERLITRIQATTPSPRDFLALRLSLEQVPLIISQLCTSNLPRIKYLADALEKETPAALIAHVLVDEPPLRLSDGNFIREGVNEELDTLRKMKGDSVTYLTQYQEKLRTEIDIKTLKVSYTKAFGYYIEVSKAQASKMPDTFERRQTLVNAERFISKELKEFEEAILSADEKIERIERTLFIELQEKVAAYAHAIVAIAHAIAEIDALHSLSVCAQEYKYIRPHITKEKGISLSHGRHPIIEHHLAHARFVPNDTTLSQDTSMYMITGPNMAGKSTYIRQVALITLMAQMGSFVPAKQATIGIVDKIFSRIGASDDLARGQSTFMVEMAETANILNNSTNRSLVILDEIGRGTSTYDGIAIAWSVAEYLTTKKGAPVFTLFATHYSELTELPETFPTIRNYRVAVKEDRGSITFMHRIEEGGTDKSYGIHVAKLAGMPDSCITIAKKRLHSLKEQQGGLQLSLFTEDKKDPESPAVEKLQNLVVDDLSPRDALELLYELQALAKTTR